MDSAVISVEDQGRVLRIVDREGDTSRFHALWLRDNALDAKTRSAGNGQRLVSILDLDRDPRIEEARLESGAVSLVIGPDRYATSFPVAWLLEHRYDKPAVRAPGWVGPAVRTWGGDLQGRVPHETFSTLTTSRAALGRWLSSIKAYGFATLSELPTFSGSLCQVADLFGFVRETNYGRWFEVRAEVNPNNLAYTNLGLQAHTDNPYRDPVPTLQLLACLENSVEGGESVVVDGFKIAEALRQEDPAAFALLARNPARFEYAGSSDVRLTAKRPVVELGPDGELLAIRFNNRSAAPLTDVPFAEVPAYYAAYRRFAELVEDQRFSVSFKLKPGELFIVDNTRVLHARTAFAGSGSRWLQGCYADKDGLLSTLAAIEHEQQAPETA